jgi:hypothetical protein
MRLRATEVSVEQLQSATSGTICSAISVSTSFHIVCIACTRQTRVPGCVIVLALRTTTVMHVPHGMLTYFLLYLLTTCVLHTEMAALGLSISVVDVTLSDAYGTRSDIATSQNLAHGLEVNYFKSPFTAHIHTAAPSYCPLHGRW